MLKFFKILIVCCMLSLSYIYLLEHSVMLWRAVNMVEDTKMCIRRWDEYFWDFQCMWDVQYNGGYHYVCEEAP